MKTLVKILFAVLTYFGWDSKTSPKPSATIIQITKNRVPERRCDRVCTTPNWLKMALNARR